ncbi:MAG: metallophosphoesterase family protein [Terriglobales bacterium]
MRICICSDVHANWEALQALPGGFDRLFCLGDLVDYGPSPRECVAWMRPHASACVRGNHDHAIGWGADPRCSPPYRRLADTTGAATAPMLAASDLAYLRELPEQLRLDAGGARFLLSHATVHEPLFGYVAAEDTARWQAELENVAADFILTGHTHIAFQRRYGSRVLLNPGSVGQSKMQGGRAYYAFWDDGEIELRSVPYAYTATQMKLRQWTAVPVDVREELATVLAQGGLPQ